MSTQLTFGPLTFQFSSQVNVKKWLRFHQSRHEVDVDAGVVNLSYDGVEATKSCHRSFEVLSAKFDKCRVVYPLAIGIGGASIYDVCKIFGFYFPPPKLSHR